MVSRTVNSFTEFRTCFNEEGQLGYWDNTVPSYTIFHPDDKTFSCIWTAFSNKFSEFYSRYQDDIQRYGDRKGIFTKDNEPKNIFPISSVPWISFTRFNLDINNDEDFLLPIITSGKFFRQEDKMLLPISLQAHHAVCDGYHASTFIEELQGLANNCHEWIP